VPGGYYAPNYSRLLVFGLDGKASLPPVIAYTPPPLDPPSSTASAEVIAAGHEAYGKYCAACHGQNGQTRGSTFPNLMLSPLLKSQDGFNQVVLQGARSARGMASFAAVLKPEDAVAVREYVISIANEAKAKAPPPPPASAPKQAHE
jgi:alcohol dehydrogenase (cytochrome c)/quinohemoprotein ethanol dehydrogenase